MRLVAWIRVQGGGGKWSALGCVLSITNRKKVQGGKEEPRRPPLPQMCSLMPLPQVRAERSEDLLLGVAEAVSCQEEVWAGSWAAGADQPGSASDGSQDPGSPGARGEGEKGLTLGRLGGELWQTSRSRPWRRQ